MTIGIYRIRNKIDNKFYIGRSINIENRIMNHFSYLRNNKHHSPYLQNAWNKYGEENFYHEIIEEIKEENMSELIEKEQYYLDYYQSYDNRFGYNASNTSIGSGTLLHGEKIVTSILTDNQVKDMKLLFRDTNLRNKDIMEIFNISRSTLQNIKAGKSWRHIIITDDMKLSSEKLKIYNQYNKGKKPKQLSTSEIIEIKKILIKNEKTNQEIAELFDCSASIIGHIGQGRKYSEIKIENEYLLYEKSAKSKIKLSESKVKEIKKMLIGNIPVEVIANKFNITKTTISDISNKRTWRHVV